MPDYANRDTGLQMILGDRYLETLLVDPRYEAMVEKMGLRVNPHPYKRTITAVRELELT